MNIVVTKKSLGSGDYHHVVVTKGGSGSGDFGHAGRPGEVGGSAGDNRIDVRAIADKKIRENIDTFIDKYKDSPVEYGRIMDEYGATDQDYGGSKNGLNLPYNKFQIVRYHNGTFIHNHPSEGGGFGFSTEDVAMAAKYDLKTTVVITHNPNGTHTKYTLQRGSKLWFHGLTWTSAGNVLMEYLQEARGKGMEIARTDRYAANIFMGNHIIRRFAEEFGHTYTEEQLP